MANGRAHVGAPAPSNGVLTANPPPGNPSVNRKKAKRRAKQAAKQAAEQHPNPNLKGAWIPKGSPYTPRPVAPNGAAATHDHHQALDYEGDYDDPDQFDPADGDEYYTDDEATQTYGQHYDPAMASANGDEPDNLAVRKSKKKPKKKKRGRLYDEHDVPSGSSSGVLPHSGPNMHPPPPASSLATAAALRTVHRSANSKDRIWNTSSQEERERIREFWLSLSEDERKSLVKIEKEAVLRKMKEQQKHACSCTVCGRKRTAIEEELEVLYDAYYEELELYGDQEHIPDNSDSMLTKGRPESHSHHLPPDRGLPEPYDAANRVEELGDEEEDEDDLDDEDYSESEDDDEYSDEEEPEELPPRGAAADFFHFGNSLTVQGLSDDYDCKGNSWRLYCILGGILTVADDLLKNDGKKFIEMMEQLAARRMQREDQVVEHAGSYAYTNAMQHPHSGHHHGNQQEEDDYDEEDDDYDSQEDDYDEEDDELDSMTEQQRMREGRRMFQIFAARMFEQRVLSAYREKVANERQQKLIEELEEETRREAEREAKKNKEAQKKKEKRALQKQKQAEEKARKDAEKRAEEEAAKAAEAKKQEELRRKREEQKKKKEAERKAQEEERKRKEAEKQRRLQQERERQQEAERKAQEQKAAEKKAREEAKRKEREEKEAREREAREQRAHAEQQRREKEARIKSEREAKERQRREEEAAKAAQQAAANHRPAQPTPALPPGLVSKQSSTGLPSPHVQVATPNIPKAPTPVKPRQTSQQGSHGSSPKTPHVHPGLNKPSSPTMSGAPAPKTILQKPPISLAQTTAHHGQPSSPLNSLGPPPGMHAPAGFGGFPGLGAAPSPMQGFNQPRGQMFPPPMNSPYPGFPAPNGLPAPPPGMTMSGGPLGRGYPIGAPPGFGQPLPGLSSVNQTSSFGAPVGTMSSHSRQASAGSFEKNSIAGFDSPAAGSQTHPITRPAPIQRPSSVKPHDFGQEQKRTIHTDIDDLSNHLGSSALLDDSDEPMTSNPSQVRRNSLIPAARSNSRMGFGATPLFTEQPRVDPFAMPSGGTPWGTPTMPNPFGQTGFGGNAWGSSPTSGGGWPSSFSSMGGPLGGAPHRPSLSRPGMVRLMVCRACQQLAQTSGGADGFYDIPSIIRTIDTFRTGEPPVMEHEVNDICETEGDAHNGGGFLFKRDAANGASALVKFEPDENSSGDARGSGRPLGGLGEIGSPVPSYSTPAGSISRGPSFPGSLGGISSPGF
ncbi:salt tolerance down-regulator-domain-containing protein [Phyllosticta paracitricarpa]|uniref:Stress response protein NST1 n=1 Tax=Phyllosticta paracitricarpa TaxID=2016321 RepID=A0ABR1N122_9PEZI